MKRVNKINWLCCFIMAGTLSIHFLGFDALAAEGSGGWRPIYDEVLLWLNFGILVFVFIKYGRAPLMNFLRGRKEKIAREIERIEEKKKQAAERAALEQKALEERKAKILAQKKKEEERENYRPPDLPGMVYFPKVTFNMGDIRCYPDCNTVHRITLAPFYLDMTEVTNEAFHKFVKEAGHAPPKNKRNKYNLWRGADIPDEIKRQPVINVNWKSASEYCLFVKKRLPTEAEWEYGARGIEARMYPWGEDDPTPVLAQFDGEWSGPETLYEVDFFEPGRTSDGLYNMLGGVKEWVQDWYSADYYQNPPPENPKGPEVGERRSVRGGSWEEVPEISAVRDSLDPKSQLEGLGFRCAKTVIIPE